MRGSHLAISGLIVVVFALAAAPANAQSNTAAAVALFDEGRAALQQGELDLACAKFQESNRIGPAIGTTFNLANCEEQRGRLATAWVLFRQVVGQMKPDDPRLPVANEHITRLEKRVPRVVFVADKRTPPGTRVRVGETELESGSFGSAIPLDPGKHDAIVRSPGRAPRALTFTLAPEETRTLSLTPPTTKPPKTARVAPDTTAEPDGQDDRVLGLKRSNAVLIAGGIGAAGLVVGAVTGLVGLDAESTGNQLCSHETRSCPQEGYDANQRAKSMAIVSTVGFAIGILGGGAATYLYVSGPTSDSTTEVAFVGLRGRW
jgi:hypothetical protein